MVVTDTNTWLYSPGVKDPAEWAEVFRRLYVPQYEEARQYWASAEADGFFSETDESYRYFQDALKKVISDYGNDD